MVKIERTPVPPPSLAIESKKSNGSYREPDVIEQLTKDFHEKCYLCEIQPLQNIHVEHLRPHGGKNHARKFDWNNLFLSCPHCNLVKNQEKYQDMILDCCVVDPETALLQRLDNGHVSVTPLNHQPETVKTAELMTECFELTNTGIRRYECQVRIDALSQTMISLYKALEQYRKNPEKGRSLKVLRGMLSRTYKFAGFTRGYIRAHLKDYPGLAQYL